VLPEPGSAQTVNFMTTTPTNSRALRVQADRKKLEQKIELYRVHLGSAAPARKYRGGQCLLPLGEELRECRRRLLKQHGREIPSDLEKLARDASVLRRSLSAKTSPRRLAAVTSKLSAVRADLIKNAGNPSARAAIVAKAPEALLPMDRRELLAKQWAAIVDPKAKTAFFREHQVELRSWLREIGERGLNPA